MRPYLLFAVFLLVMLFGALGCAARYTQQVDFNPAEPIRVAVLPFSQVNEKNEIIDGSADLLVDQVSLISSSLGMTPAQYVRSMVQRELSTSGLDILSPALVDNKLAHNGFDDPKHGIDLQKLRSADPKDLCEKLLSCDAVLLGTVRRWDRSYYGIQSVTSVSLDLKLIAGKDRRVLFSASGEDSDSRGITKGPTGISDLVLEPIKGLDSKITEELAAQIVKKMLSSFHVEERPEFLQSAPPMILASAHDLRGVVLPRGQPLTVLLYGTPHQLAFFSIENSIDNIPMVEKDEGHYIGKYYPLPSDRFENRKISVYLTDSFGRASAQTLGGPGITLQ